MRKFAKLCHQDNDLTLTWNIDGISLFESSKKSTQSILAIVNEISYKIAKDYVFLAGVWHGFKKPKMEIFLKPFIDDGLKLSTIGMKCATSVSEQPIHYKVHSLLAFLDTIARPMV